MHNFHVQKRFKRLQLSRLRDSQSLQQFLYGVFPANKFNSRLRTKSSIPSQDQNRSRRIQPRQKADDRIVLSRGLIRRRSKERFWLTGEGMNVHHRQVPLSRSRIEAPEDKFLSPRKIEQR